MNEYIIPWYFPYDITEYEKMQINNKQEAMLKLYLQIKPDFIYRYDIDTHTYIDIYYKDNKFYIENDDIIYSSENYENIRVVFHSIFGIDFTFVEVDYEISIGIASNIEIQSTPYIDINNIDNMSDIFTNINVSERTKDIEENNEFKTIILDKPNDVYDKIMDIMIIITFICIFTLMIVMIFDLILNN